MKNRYSPLREAQGGRGERSETQGDALPPLNEQTPNNNAPSFASFKNHSHHGSKCQHTQSLTSEFKSPPPCHSERNEESPF